MILGITSGENIKRKRGKNKKIVKKMKNCNNQFEDLRGA